MRIIRRLAFVAILVTARAAAGAQPPPSEFVPVDQLPPGDQLPAAPLVITAYAFVWIVFTAYLWLTGRRLARVEAEIRALESRLAKGR